MEAKLYKTVDAYYLSINEYSDIDMETIQDIIDIKLLENKIKH